METEEMEKRCDEVMLYMAHTASICARGASGAWEWRVTVRHEVDVAGICWEGDDAILTCSPCGDECAADDEGVATDATTSFGSVSSCADAT